jgi:positive regulator of sigma E activity
MTHLVDSMIKSVYDLFSVIWIYFFPMLLMFVVAFVSYLFKINNI